MSPEEVLDEVEKRIRAQVATEPMFSAPWCMGMACVAHIGSVRLMLEEA